MRLFRSWRYARGMSLLATVILLCIGVLLCMLPTVLGVAAALTMAHSSHLDQGANEGYLAVFREEAEEGTDGRPVNTDLLRARSYS
jgi:hypothetical protein